MSFPLHFIQPICSIVHYPVLGREGVPWTVTLCPILFLHLRFHRGAREPNMCRCQSDIVKLMLGAVVLLIGQGCVSLQGQNTSSIAPF